VVESAKLAWEQGTEVVALLTIPFGVNTGQLHINLDININPGTQLAILKGIVHCLSIQGIYKLVIRNMHGGNDFNQMSREVQAQYPQVLKFLLLSAYLRGYTSVY